jgi:hypothetical protein
MTLSLKLAFIWIRYITQCHNHCMKHRYFYYLVIWKGLK